MNKPREFWISGVDFKTYSIPENGAVTAMLSNKNNGKPEAIHVREVTPADEAKDALLREAYEKLIPEHIKGSKEWFQKYRVAYGLPEGI